MAYLSIKYDVDFLNFLKNNIFLLTGFVYFSTPLSLTKGVIISGVTKDISSFGDEFFFINIK